MNLGFSHRVSVVRDNICIIPVMIQTKTIIVENVKLVNSASVNFPQHPIEILLFLPQGLKDKRRFILIHTSIWHNKCGTYLPICSIYEQLYFLNMGPIFVSSAFLDIKTFKLGHFYAKIYLILYIPFLILHNRRHAKVWIF